MKKQTIKVLLETKNPTEILEIMRSYKVMLSNYTELSSTVLLTLNGKYEDLEKLYNENDFVDSFSRFGYSLANDTKVDTSELTFENYII
jgi:hypothetical protein